MLESFRKLSNNIIFKILFGILLIAFLFSGAGLTKLSRISFTDDYAVKVGSHRISDEAIDNKYKQSVCRLRRLGLDMTEDQLAANGLSKVQVERNLVQESLLNQEASGLGLGLSEDALEEHIKSIPELQDEGKFNRDKFNVLINNLCMTEPEFLANLHDEMRNDLLTDTIAGNIPINDYIAGREAAYYGEKRDIELVIIPQSIKAPVNEPTEDDLKNFYSDHSFQFQVPESRDISYIKLEKGKDDNSTYDATVKIQDELAGGSTLKEVADKLKLQLQTKTGLAADDKDFSPLFLQTAFAKDKGQVSDLITDEKNNEYFVIEITDVKPAHIPEMAQVRDKVVAAWKADAANDQNLKYIQKMADELKTSHEDLRHFAAANGYTYDVLKDVKRNDTEINGARLVNDAFSAKAGDLLGSYQNSDGTYKIAKLKDINPANLTADEKAKYRDDLANEMRVEAMDEYFDALRKKYPVKQNMDVAKADAFTAAKAAASGNTGAGPGDNLAIPAKPQQK